MAQVINIIIGMVPFGSIAAAPVQFALFYWDRMSEVTADRAGLLCCQNKDAAVRAFMKMAGMPIKQFNDMKYQTFIQQAKDFKQLDFDGMNKIIKTISIADDTHPWTVMRAAELLNWIDNGDYASFTGATTEIKRPVDAPIITDDTPVVITKAGDKQTRKNKYLNN